MSAAVFALVMIGLACGAVTLTALQVRANVNEISGRVDRVVDQANTSLETINRPCGHGETCGTLAELQHAVMLTEAVEKTQATIFDKTLPGLLTQAQGSFDHLNASLANVDAATVELPGVVKDADARLNDLGRLEGNVTQFVADLDASSQATFANLNALTGDPHWRSTLANVDAVTSSADKMLDTANQVETKATRNYLHPSRNPFVRTWRNVWPYVLPSAQITGAVLR